MTGLAARLLALAGLLLAAAPAAAQQAPERDYYFIEWSIVPQETLAPTQWVKPYTSITSARLLPLGLYATGEDVVQADGAPLLPAGIELAAARSKQLIACTMQAPRNKGLGAVVFLGLDRYVCLVDGDRDGRFESYFRLRTPAGGVLAGGGKIPKKLVPLKPVAYSGRAPASAATAPRIYLQYGWFASFVNELIFQTCLTENNNTDTGCFGPHITVKRTQLPAEFEALGGRFRVEAKNENQVQVTMLSAFAAQPLFLFY